MELKWLFLVTLFAASAVTAQDYDDDGWWSHEISAESIINLNERKELSNNDAINDDYPVFDLPDEVKKGDDINLDEILRDFNVADGLPNVSEVKNDEDVDESLDDENVAVQIPAEDNTDEIVQEEIKQIREELDEPNSKVADNYDDYQVEDNRFDTKDERPPKPLVEEDDHNDGEFSMKDHDDHLEADAMDGINLGLNIPEFGANLDFKIGFANDRPSDVDDIVAEANKLLQEENGEFEEDIEDGAQEKNQEKVPIVTKISESHELESNIDKDDSQDDAVIVSPEQKYESDIAYDEPKEKEVNFKDDLDEFEKIDALKYENDMIDPEEENKKAEDETNANISQIEDDASSKEEEEEEDTVDKVYEDLHSDLEKLFETWDKLTADDIEESDKDDTLARDEYEKKYGTPDKESVVLKDRDDFYDAYGAIDDDVLKSSFEADSDSDQYYNDDTILKGFEAVVGSNEDVKDDLPVVISVAEKTSNDEDVSSDEEDMEKDELPEVIPIAEETSNEADANRDDKIEVINELPEVEETYNEEELQKDVLTSAVKTIDVENLTPEQYRDVMAQFALVHASEVDTEAEDFGRNVAAVHITLSTEEVTEITSPNFPSTYPTNNVVDWILEGEGTGIELNITDLELRGAQADFLLIKPGGLDDSGHEGLIFSYHLNEPRQYRFTDVSRMFVRFQPGAGLGFLKGFRMTVKMIWPPANLEEEEDLPEAEPLLPSLPATLTVNLGITKSEFYAVEDNFRRLIADMAAAYINAYNIDSGMNSTSETAQITNVVVCNINWPSFEDCTQVTFGVPVVYEDEDMTRLDEIDLLTMWTLYIDRDPYAARLTAMGISIFEVPNDRRVLLVWVVLAVGILISAAMLTLALWRYSCFEDYTRMKSFGDTDSLREEKRGLDLYPTPHQTLPPLYADQDYKWADAKYDDTTRVDIGGFANSSYVPDELFDIDSDEEVVKQRGDRNGGYSPRNIHQV